MKRRSFVARCASAALIGPFLGQRAFAQEDFVGSVGTGIAQKIATSLAETAIGEGMDQLGLGNVWAFLSGSKSDESGAVLARLNEISQQLQGISHQISQLQGNITEQFAKEDFDTVAAPVQVLINANKTLRDDYNALFQGARKGWDISGTLTQISVDMPKIYGGLNDWHAALIGEERTSVIVAANQKSNTNPDFYTQQAAARFQGLWDLFDAQQAMTTFYLCEHFNASNQHFRVQDTIRTYLQNRRQQLLLVRGQQRNVTEAIILTIGGSPRLLRGQFSGPPLPAGTIVARKPPYLMWYLKMSGPVAQGSSTYEDICQLPHSAAQLVNVERDSSRASFIEQDNLTLDGLVYARATGPQVESLISAAGGTYDGDGGGNFVDALEGLGFVFPAAVSNVWALPALNQPDPQIRSLTAGEGTNTAECGANNTVQRAGDYFSGNDLYREGDSPELPSTDPNAVGASVYCRPTQGQYFY